MRMPWIKPCVDGPWRKTLDQHKRTDDDAALEAHSLPGANQAGKGPGPCHENDEVAGPVADDSEDQNEPPPDQRTERGAKRPS